MGKLRDLVPALLLACSPAAAMAQSGPAWVDPPAQLAPAPPVPADASPANPPAVAPRPPRPQAAPSPPARRSEALETRRRAAAEVRSRAADAPRPRAVVRAPSEEVEAVPGARPRVAVRTPAPEREPEPRMRAVERASPSFNCRYARTSVEHAICDDAELATKDRIMASLYEKVGGSRHGPVDPTQWRWLAARDACARVPRGALYSCIERLYDARIAELSGWRR